MKTILVVDDHEVLARLSCEILRSQGYNAVCAYSGADALQMFSSGKVDLVVTDLRMDGMDGLELARRIRQLNSSMPVIMVTGYDPVESGGVVNECLHKCEMFPTLIDKIRFYLGEHEEVTTRSA